MTGPFANEEVNLHVNSPDGVLVIGITFHDRKVVQFDAKSRSNPIATVTTDSSTVESVMHSDQPFDAFRAAMRNGTVTIEGNNLVGKLRVGMILFGLWVLDVLGL